MDGNKQSTNSTPATGTGAFSVSSNSNTPNDAALNTNIITSSSDDTTPIVTPLEPITSPQPVSSAALDTIVSQPEPTHPFFADHPSQTFNTATGDIILDSGKSSKTKISKKPLIIGGIIILVLAIVLGVVMVIRSGHGNMANASVSIAEAHSKFNRFANYALYEKEDTEALSGSYSSYTSYALDQQFEENNNEQYWATATKLLKDAVETFDKIEDAETSMLYSKIHSYAENFNFLNMYRTINEISADDIALTYLNDGEQGATKLITEYYTNNIVSISPVAELYAEERYAQYESLVNYISYIDGIGCFGWDGVDNDRLNAHPNLNISFITEQQEVMNKADTRAEMIINGLVKDLESGCWQIDNLFNGPIFGEQDDE